MEVGQSVDFLRMKSTIRYIGKFHAKPGTWVGVELPLPKGKNNGTVKGVKYFSCPENCGVFVKEEVFLGAIARSQRQTETKLKKIQLANNSPKSPEDTTKKEVKIAKDDKEITPNKQKEEVEGTPKFERSKTLDSLKTHENPQTPTNNDAVKQKEAEEDKNITPKSEKHDLRNAPTPTDKSEDLQSIHDEINESKAQLIKLKQVYQDKREEFNNTRALYMQTDKKFKDAMTNLKNEHIDRVKKLSVEELQRSIEIEEQTLATLEKELELRKTMVSNETLKQIETLQKINDEHNEFERELREVSRKFSANISAKMLNMGTIEKKLFKYQQLVKNQIDKEEMIKDDIKQLEDELDSQKPALQESESLKIRFKNITELSENHEKKMGVLNEQRCAMNDFIEMLIPLSKPSFTPLILLRRIHEKTKLLKRSPENEMLLHFCVSSMTFLAGEVTDTEHFDTLINELRRIENDINNFKQPTFDIDILNRLVQRHTKQLLNEAITSHLVMASALRVTDSNTKSDLIQIAKQIKGVIHPSLVSKSKEEAENLAIDLRKELRKADTGKPVEISGLEQRINLIQMVKIPFERPEIIIGPKVDKNKAEEEEDPEMLELRRRLRDAEAMSKTYTKQIKVLQEELNGK